jgi:hypothetical protein
MTQQERNKEIALMLGLQYDKECVIYIMTAYSWDMLRFHSDWNWLMGAIKKILSIVSENDDMEIYNIIIDQIPDIEAVFIAVSQFAKLYNENKL